MFMMRIAVVDDDQSFISEISEMIRSFFSEKEYEQDDFNDGMEFVQSITSGSTYEIVFMDIEMSGMNGRDAVRALREYDVTENTYVIYVSSHTDNLCPLFSLHPFDFLVKPLEYNQVASVLRKICSELADRKKCISVVVNRREADLCLAEIMYIQSDSFLPHTAQFCHPYQCHN